MNNGVTTFESSRAVLNIPYASQAKGRLHAYMGGGTIYRALSKVEAKHPGTVAIPASNAAAVSVSKNANPMGVTKLNVSYSPVVSAVKKSETKAARAAEPRQVVSIVRRSDAAAQPTSKLPTMLRHSMSDHLSAIWHRRIPP